MRDLAKDGVRVQCCVTSPPYFGLRDYGHPEQIGLENTPAEYVAALVEPMILAGSRSGDAVLDPFMGSGTVGQVAQALGRKWLWCELNPDYGPLQKLRTAQHALGI